MKIRKWFGPPSLLLFCFVWPVSYISPLGAVISEEQTANSNQKPADVPAPDVEGWEAIRGSDSPALFEQFLKEYPESKYAGAARLKLAALRNTKSPTSKVMEPAILRKADAEYSEEARGARLQGTVLISANVDERGQAKEVQVVRGLGFGLDKKAVDSVQHWQFQPGTRDGVAAVFRMTYDVDFRLPDGGPWRIEGTSLARNFEKGVRPGIETKPQIRKYVSPSAAACSEKGGYVVVQLQIDKNGSPSGVKALASPSASLGESAVAAVQAWVFSPALLDNKPKPSGGRVVLACEGPGFSVDEADRSDKVVRLAPGFAQPKVIFKLDPEYSEEARKAKESGTVGLRIVIDQMGRPKSVAVSRSLGHGLDEKAVEAVAQWRFQPAMNADKPVNTTVSVDVNFKLL